MLVSGGCQVPYVDDETESQPLWPLFPRRLPPTFLTPVVLCPGKGAPHLLGGLSATSPKCCWHPGRPECRCEVALAAGSSGSTGWGVYCRGGWGPSAEQAPGTPIPFFFPRGHVMLSPFPWQSVQKQGTACAGTCACVCVCGHACMCGHACARERVPASPGFRLLNSHSDLLRSRIIPAAEDPPRVSELGLAGLTLKAHCERPLGSWGWEPTAGPLG